MGAPDAALKKTERGTESSSGSSSRAVSFILRNKSGFVRRTLNLWERRTAHGMLLFTYSGLFSVPNHFLWKNLITKEMDVNLISHALIVISVLLLFLKLHVLSPSNFKDNGRF